MPCSQVHARDRAATIAAATSTASQVCLSHKILEAMWNTGIHCETVVARQLDHHVAWHSACEAFAWFQKSAVFKFKWPYASQTRTSSGVVEENSTGISRHAYMGRSARRSWYDIYGIVLPISSVFTRKASSQFELDTGCRLLNVTWPNKKG